jgi:beta-lactamase class A
MQKLHDEKINPETKILVTRGNWTEDAGKTWVGAEYSLKAIMQDMISHSSNIATNQLIDYMGWDYINKVLRDRGYTTTAVRTKLVGQSTYPANLGNPPNFITTDELTDMMVGIYNQEHPGDNLIIDGLVNQYDLELGYEAVKRPAVWIGEKTGQNSKVLGSTTGVNIKGDRYVVTVTIDNTGSEPAVKTVIQGVVDYLVKNNGFGGDSEPPAKG